VKTKHADVVAYWSERVDDIDLGVEWHDAHERCWRCGYKPKALERCHIVPDALGGKDAPENLVLLCFKCHRDAPNVGRADAMWTWIAADHGTVYDTYWTFRGIDEFKRIHGRLPFSGPAFDGVQSSEVPTGTAFEALLVPEMRNTVTHTGEGRVNPSSIAFVLEGIERRFLASWKRGQLLLFPEVH